MSDYGTRVTELNISEVDRRLRKIYKQAQEELEKKLADFNRKSAAKDKYMQQQVADGKISQQAYKDWLTGQVFIRSQWESKVKQVSAVMYDHNAQAIKLINEGKLNTFAENYNFASFQAEKHIVGISFNMYNAEAVSRLLLDDPKLLPEWDLNKGKDYVWNKQKINNIITQGIIQGGTIPQITKQLCEDLSSQNESRMRTFARTAMTGAENAGRQQQMHDATAMGLTVLKEWMATHDSRTRDSHRYLDGQQVPEDQPFESLLGEIMYPGDPDADDPGDIYNCRCTSVARYPDYEDVTKPSRWTEETIDGMSYEEWKAGKTK